MDNSEARTIHAHHIPLSSSQGGIPNKVGEVDH